MSRVIFDISMSLDGFMTAAANRRPDQPMGDGGLRLVEWAFGNDERDHDVLVSGVASTSAVIAGRRTYDDSLPWWGADGPTGPDRLPVFVLTHHVPETAPEGGVYTFVTDGIEEALKRAIAAAGDGKNVCVMGGAQTGQAYLRAGLIDELSIHLVPVLFGNGTRMFDNLFDKPGGQHLQLENLGSVQTPSATHLRFKIVK